MPDQDEIPAAGPELTDKNGRPLTGAALANRLNALGRPPRPKPGALEADIFRGQQIQRLEARVEQLEHVLGPAFASRPDQREAETERAGRLYLAVLIYLRRYPDATDDQVAGACGLDQAYRELVTLARQAEAEHRALACAVVALAAEIGRMPGPDALARRLGTQDALAICEAAGLDVPAIQARWTAAVPAPQVQRRQADVFASDPMHHPAVVNAQVCGGDVRAALAEVATDMSSQRRAQRASLALDYLASGRMSLHDALEAVERQLDKDRRHQDPGGMPVPIGVSAGADGLPRQRSAVHQDVPELGK